MWILVWICDADVCQFNVEELVDRMQSTTYTNQTQIITRLNTLLMGHCKLATICLLIIKHVQ